MFWTINSITEAKEQFPTLSSLWDETMSGNSLGNMTDADINWDYLYEKVTGNSFSVQPDYRIPAEERTEDNRRDYSQWSVSKIYIIPHKSMTAMNRICSCQNSRFENEDPSPLTGRTAHHDHDEVHRLHNVFANMNEDRQVPANAWNQNGSVGNEYYLQGIIRRNLRQYTDRFAGGRQFKMSSKHTYYKSEAERVVGSNLHYVIFIHADEDGVDRCWTASYLIPYQEPGSRETKISHQVAYNLNETTTPFYGYMDQFGWDMYEKVLYKNADRSGVRQYKECKSCGQHVNKNNCVFAIDMGSDRSRYSICFLCVPTQTAGYDPNTKAFVRYPNMISNNESRMRDFLRHRMLDSDTGAIIGKYTMTLVPFFRNIPNTRNSSAYAWDDVSSSHPDWMRNNGIPSIIHPSLEARKYLTWATTEDVFTPDEGAYESIGHVGNTFDWFGIDNGDVESLMAWDGLTDGGINIYQGYEENELSESEYERGQVTETDWYAISNHNNIEYYDGDANSLYDYSMFLSIYDPTQWDDYMNANSYRGSTARPSVRQVVRIDRAPIHVVRHGLPEMNLEKNTWDFTFPVWQVALGNHADGRLIKPVGQDSWSNPEMMMPAQIMSMSEANNQPHSDMHAHVVNSQIGPFYGVELEIVGRREIHNHDSNQMENTHRRLIEAFHPTWSEVNSQRAQLAYRVKDSSVDSGSAWGQEVVTQPISIGAWQQTPDDFWTMLKDNYVAMYHEGGSRNFGNGIHIHMDHDAFTTGHLWAFVDYFVRQHQVYLEEGEEAAQDTLLYKVAQRGSGRWAHWRLPYHDRTRSGRQMTNVNDIIAATALRRRTDRGSDGKYDGINFTKDNTIELRYFNSTTVKDRVLARVEFVEAVYRTTKEVAASIGHFDTREGSENEAYRDFFVDLTSDWWDDKLWHHVLSSQINRLRYSNLIKLGRETSGFDLNRLFGAHTMYSDTLAQARQFVDTLVDITEEGGTQ
jgi:hypothetical protein